MSNEQHAQENHEDMMNLSPPPETGAVDVEADKVVAGLIGVLRVLYSRAQGFTWDEAKPFIATVIQPLTARITFLEQENERLKCDLDGMAINRNGWMRRAESAEARIQELEQKLEAALKLTTEQSIDNMRSKA